jgi:hypothetical protein
MESKGRRAPRVARPVEAPAKVAQAVEVPVEASAPTETAIEPPNPADTTAEVAEPVENSELLEASAAATQEAAASSEVSVETKATTSEKVVDFGREPLAALTESQAALARGLEALSAEMIGLTLSGIDTAARAASKMLGIKTLSDAIEVNAGFTCSSFDALIGGSARLSELGVKLATETSQPLLSQLGKDWTKAARRGS